MWKNEFVYKIIELDIKGFADEFTALWEYQRSLLIDASIWYEISNY